MNELNKIRVRTLWARILNYFLRGLVVLLPIALTIGILLWFFGFLANALGINATTSFAKVFFWSIGGLTLIIGIGFFVKGFVAQQILDFVEGIVEKAPGLKFIFGTTRDLTEAFVGDNKKFNKPVIVNVKEDTYKLGFLTQENMKRLDMPGHCAVYFPYSYGLNGEMLIVPISKVRRLDIESGHVTKFVVSGGVASLDDRADHRAHASAALAAEVDPTAT